MRIRKAKESKEIKLIEAPETFFERFKDKPPIIKTLYYIIEKSIEQENLVKKAQLILERQTEHARKMVEEIRKFEDRHRDELRQLTGINFNHYADWAANYFYHLIDEDFFKPHHTYECIKIDENTYLPRIPELKGYSSSLTIKTISKDLKISTIQINEVLKVLTNKNILEVKTLNAKKYYKIQEEYFKFFQSASINQQCIN